MKKKSKLNEFFIAGGVVSRKPFDDILGFNVSQVSE